MGVCYNSKGVVIIRCFGQLFIVYLMVAQFVGGATLFETFIGIPSKIDLLFLSAVIIVHATYGSFTLV
ncbi:MAG: hypothetical protein HUJ51_00075 [Eggerthellaceae bacterium]|nr:hypothetical protein [Eggerthellaceae bacterium]